MINGFKFGMMLQLAIGPIFIFILNTSLQSSIFTALISVMIVGLVDAFYIFLAILGLGALLERYGSLQRVLSFCSSLVIMLFGISTLLAIFEIGLLPVLSLNYSNTNNIFIKVLLITISNPLTILFWTGVFTTKIQKEELSKSQLYLFGSGAVLSTLVFLSLISILGKFISPLLNTFTYNSLNLITAMFLIIYSIHILLKSKNLNNSCDAKILLTTDKDS